MSELDALLRVFKACDETTIRVVDDRKPERPSGATWTCRKVEGGVWEIFNAKSETRQEIISLAAKILHRELSAEEITALSQKLPRLPTRVQSSYEPPRRAQTVSPTAIAANSIRFDRPPLNREPWNPPSDCVFAKVEGRVCTVQGPENDVRAARDQIVALLRGRGIVVPEDVREFRIVVEE
jgi:hypothetical protein